MFNPKGNNLLDEQLSVSGLEMNWVFAAVGAAASIAGGIMGMNQASKNNSKAKKNAKKQRQFNKKVANKTNDYNKKVDKNTEANYHAMRDFNHKVAMQNWERGKEIHDYEFDSAMKQYEKSQEIGNAQLGLNTREAASAVASEQLALNDAFLEKQFAITDSKVALEDELQRQNLNRQSLDIERRSTQEEGKIARKGQKNRLKIASAEADLNMQQEASNLKQTYAEAGIATRGQLANLSGTYAEQAINKKEQYAQLQGIKSRKSTGTASIENTIEQLMAQGNVAKESAMVEGLLAEGQASLGQAGKSTAKAKQSSKAALQRQLMALSSELSGKRKQAGIQLAELNAELSLAKTGVGLNLQRIDAAVSGAESRTRLNIEGIDTSTRGAEEAARIGMGRIQTGLQATTQDVNLQLRQQLSAERFAMEGLDIKTASINDAINIANRDYIQQRDMIDRNYDSAKAQSELNVEYIGLQKEFADLNTRAGMMLKPEKLPYNPKPQEPPEHIFIKSQKAIPGFVPSPATQNIYAPLVQGVGAAAGQLAGVDFSKGPFGG